MDLGWKSTESGQLVIRNGDWGVLQKADAGRPAQLQSCGERFGDLGAEKDGHIHKFRSLFPNTNPMGKASRLS